MTDRPRPTLDASIVENPRMLASVVWEFVRGLRRVRLHDEHVRHLQRELQILADEPAWECFLYLEAATNARGAEVGERIAAWAFEQGRTYERGQRSG